MSDQPVAEAAQLGDVTIPELYRSGRAKKQRARRNRIISYVVGAVLLVAVALLGDWATIQEKYFDIDRVKSVFPEILTIGAKNTVVYTVSAFIGGTIVGVSMAVLKMSPIRPYRWLATVYIEIFRGLPALLTIIFVGFVTPTALGVQFPVVFGVDTAGPIALALVAGAYLAETVRAGIEGVPRGQVEASRSLGLTQAQTLRVVVVPQAFRLVIPPLTNELVLLLKDTALLSVLGTTAATVELTQFGRSEFNTDFNGTPMIVAGLLYLAITIPLTQLVGVLERRLKASR